MKLNKNLAVSESGFIFNPSTGDSFSVNGIGAEILELLRADNNLENILNTLSQKYEVEKPVLEKDVDDFLMLLRDNNMMQK